MSQFKLKDVDHKRGNLQSALGVSIERVEVFAERLTKIIKSGETSVSRTLEKMSEIAEDQNELTLIVFTVAKMLS